MAGGDSQVTPGNCGAHASLARLAPTLPLPPAHSTPRPWGVESPDRQGGSRVIAPPTIYLARCWVGYTTWDAFLCPIPVSSTSPSGLDDHLIPPRSGCVLGNFLGTHWEPVPQGGLGHSGGSRKTDSLSLSFAHLPLPAGACTGLIDNAGREQGRPHSPPYGRPIRCQASVPSFSTWGTEGLVTKSLVQASPQGTRVI